MKIQDYLKQCNVGSVDELTDEQVIAYYDYPDVYVGQKCAVSVAMNFGRASGFTKQEIMASIRKSLSTGIEFRFYYITGESANGPSEIKSRWVMEP